MSYGVDDVKFDLLIFKIFVSMEISVTLRDES